MIRGRLLVLASLPVLFACASKEVVSNVTTPKASLGALTGEGATVALDSSGALTLTRGGVSLLTIPPEGFALGRITEVTDDKSYDPYPIVVPNPLYLVPSDLTYETPTRAELVSESGQSLQARLVYPDRDATLAITIGPRGRFDFLLTPEGNGIAFMRLGPHIDPNEGLYGLGESYDDVNQRGKIRAMQLELESRTESPDNEAHAPIPLLMGTTGWGLYVESAHAGVFEVASKQADLVEATFGTGADSSKGLAFHLFTADRPIDLTRYYYDLTGYPKLPARWALGPLLWRDENTGQAQFESDLEAMRSLDLATTGVWLDHPYATGVSTFDFDPTRYQDPKEMIAHANHLGFRVGVWHVPYLDENDPNTAALRAQATAEKLYPPVTGIKVNPWGILIDFTNPAATAFWQSHLKAYTDLGIEGFKLDYAEDIVPGVTEARDTWTFFDGSDERTMHTRYQYFYHSAYAQLLPEEGGLLLSRHATPGDQTNGPIMWPGDLDASFAKVGDPAGDGDSSYISVGGLPASLIAGLTLGPSGFAFYGSDTGGYRHSPPSNETFIRWFEQTSLSTAMQIGNSASTVAWELGDDSLLSLYRQYTRLHLRLFPYEWTYAENLAVDGRAIARPLGLVYPELGAHPNDEYMFGDDLLVAPVIEAGAVSRDVIFPKGRFMDWWTGDVVEDGGTETVDAPLEKLPLYMREGAIVPMLRPTIDTMNPVSDPDLIDSFATDHGLLYVRTFVGAPSSMKLYDGSRISQSGGEVVTIQCQGGSEFQKGMVIELPGFGAAPSLVTVDGLPIDSLVALSQLDFAESGGWFLTTDTQGTLHVRVDGAPHTISIAR